MRALKSVRVWTKPARSRNKTTKNKKKTSPQQHPALAKILEKTQKQITVRYKD